jgi:hypothetical protein
VFDLRGSAADIDVSKLTFAGWLLSLFSIGFAGWAAWAVVQFQLAHNIRGRIAGALGLVVFCVVFVALFFPGRAILLALGMPIATGDPVGRDENEGRQPPQHE